MKLADSLIAKLKRKPDDSERTAARRKLLRAGTIGAVGAGAFLAEKAFAQTARTTSYLNTTDFQDGQAPGSIVPSRVRDFVVSGPQWDAPGGTATPYLYRGRLDVSAYLVANGGAIGAGQSTAQRQTNATVLQNAINYCLTNQKIFEISSGTYEINSSTGLLVGTTGNVSTFVWRGSVGAVIEQFYITGSGAPIITFGDTTGTYEMTGCDVSGLEVNYSGVTTTGLTNALAIVFGGCAWCRFDNITINGYAPNAAYRAMAFTGTSAFFFSNKMTNIALYGAQQDVIYFNSHGTGNHWDNVYINNGAGNTFTFMAGSYLNFAASMQDQKFTRLNCEWGACNQLVTYAGGSQGMVFEAMHVEGVKMTGANPALFGGSAIAGLLVNGLEMDVLVTSGSPAGEPMSGTFAVVNDYTGAANVASTVQINGLNIIQDGNPDIVTPIVMYQAFSSGTRDDVTVMEVSTARTIDFGGSGWAGKIAFDEHMSLGTATSIESWGKYIYGAEGSIISRCNINVTATFTLYGQFENTNVLVPATITSFTLTLAATMGATGTALPRTGNTVHIRRQTGTASGTLTVTNGGGGGGNLTAPNTAGSDGWYQFNGTNWVTFTPVT